MIGLMALIAPVYAVAIAIAIYFAIRVFVGRRKKQIQKDIGEGICAICHNKIVAGKCPNCDQVE